MLNRQKTYEKEDAKLYLVATPIGNKKDMTYRAVETLQMVDKIYCEDTRITGQLLAYYGIETKMYSYHLHNENELTASLLEKIKQGENIAIVSDAGMPGVSDPGYLAVKMAIENHISVCVIPGVSAGVTALLGSGIPMNTFTFVGFLNSKEQKKKEELENLRYKEESLILYEAPHRIKETLELINQVMPKRYIVLARELTKRYEEYARGTASEILEVIDEMKGEMVLILSGCSKEEKVQHLTSKTIKDHYQYYIFCGFLPKEAMKQVASDRNIAKSYIYQEIFGKNKL